jgi:hypothetical protein
VSIKMSHSRIAILISKGQNSSRILLRQNLGIGFAYSTAQERRRYVSTDRAIDVPETSQAVSQNVARRRSA